MVEVKVYGTSTCPYCVRARQLLERKGVAYQWLDVAGDRARYQEMTRLSGGYTVPQIFIANQSIGGCDEMHALERQGRLDTLLGLK